MFVVYEYMQVYFKLYVSLRMFWIDFISSEHPKMRREPRHGRSQLESFLGTATSHPLPTPCQSSHSSHKTKAEFPTANDLIRTLMNFTTVQDPLVHWCIVAVSLFRARAKVRPKAKLSIALIHRKDTWWPKNTIKAKLWSDSVLRHVLLIPSGIQIQKQSFTSLWHWKCRSFYFILRLPLASILLLPRSMRASFSFRVAYRHTDIAQSPVVDLGTSFNSTQTATAVKQLNSGSV